MGAATYWGDDQVVAIDDGNRLLRNAMGPSFGELTKLNAKTTEDRILKWANQVCSGTHYRRFRFELREQLNVVQN